MAKRKISFKDCLCCRKRQNKKHPNKKWEVSIIEFQDHVGKKFKITRRLPELSVAETKVFRSKKKAKQLFEEWLK